MAKTMKTKAEVMKEIGTPLLKNNHTRQFLQGGVKGRDGKGSCRVRQGSVPMPNGHLALPPCPQCKDGDTFDPVVEGMSASRFRILLANRAIECKGDSIKIEAELIAGPKKEAKPDEGED